MHPYYLLFLSLIITTYCDNPTSISQQIPLNSQQISTFKQNLNGRTLSGQWQCIQQLFYQPSECAYFKVPRDPKVQINNQELYSPQTFFTSTSSGSIQGFFYSSDSQTYADRLYLILFKDPYRNGQVMEMDLDLLQAQKFQFQPERNQTKLVAFKQDSLIATVTLYQNQLEIVKYDISVSVEIFVEKQSFTMFHKSPLTTIDTPLKIRVFSDGIAFGTALTSPSHKDIVNVLIFIALLQIIFIFLNPSTSKQNVSKTRTIMFRISQWFILQMYAFIFIFSKEYVKLGLKYFDTELGTLIYVGLGNIGLGMLFLRKYEMVLEKFMNWKVLIMALCFVVGYWQLASEYLHDAGFWAVEMTLMLQLQVVHSMLNGGKGGLPYDLMGFMIVSRLPLVYMLAVDGNMFKTPPASSNYLILLASVFILNAGLIFLQSIKGGQFMIPNEIIPGFYNYYYTESSSEKKLEEECPICTTPLNRAPDEALEMTEVAESASISSVMSTETREAHEDTKQKIEETITKTVRYMMTPCNHLFHIQCLTRWMQSKLVCPYCRSTLPQLASLEKE